MGIKIENQITTFSLVLSFYKIELNRQLYINEHSV